jgi:hypothetical protein
VFHGVRKKTWIEFLSRKIKQPRQIVVGAAVSLGQKEKTVTLLFSSACCGVSWVAAAALAALAIHRAAAQRGAHRAGPAQTQACWQWPNGRQAD